MKRLCHFQAFGPGCGERPPAGHDLRLWPEYRHTEPIKETSEMTTMEIDELMELATPLLREALDLPPEQAAVTALGRRIRAEVERIYTAGQARGLRAGADVVRNCKAESTSPDYLRALEAFQTAMAAALRISANLTESEARRTNQQTR